MSNRQQMNTAIVANSIAAPVALSMLFLIGWTSMCQAKYTSERAIAYTSWMIEPGLTNVAKPTRRTARPRPPPSTGARAVPSVQEDEREKRGVPRHHDTPHAEQQHREQGGMKTGTPARPGSPACARARTPACTRPPRRGSSRPVTMS